MVSEACKWCWTVNQWASQYTQIDHIVGGVSTTEMRTELAIELNMCTLTCSDLSLISKRFKACVFLHLTAKPVGIAFYLCVYCVYLHDLTTYICWYVHFLCFHASQLAYSLCALELHVDKRTFFSACVCSLVYRSCKHSHLTNLCLT